jgi:hypothetical protein
MTRHSHDAVPASNVACSASARADSASLIVALALPPGQEDKCCGGQGPDIADGRQDRVWYVGILPSLDTSPPCGWLSPCLQRTCFWLPDLPYPQVSVDVGCPGATVIHR